MQATSVTLPGWYRAFAIVVGLVSIVLAFVVLVDPALGLATLVLLLAFALIIIGFDRLIAGVTGHPFGGFFGGPGGVVNEVMGSPPSSGAPGGSTGSPPKP